MNVREFLSNDQTFNEQLPKSDRARMSQIKKILGIKWNPHKDHIQITLNPWTEQTTTKRTILRFIASQYDPLGFLVPLIVPFKIFLQELWRKNIHWDQPLDNQLIETWNNLVVKCPTHIKEIPRFTIDLSQQITFHVFTDASTVAYAAVVYAHQNTHTSLLFAKSRLAPIKGMTIPKLELLAILIGVRAAQFVIKQMQLENPKVVVWSDSRCALHWIQNNSRLLPKFIQNRVEEIQMAKFAYRYIPSEHNPADIATRGTIPTRLISYEPWWSGPTWINGNEPNWPHWEYDVPQEEDNEEDKNIVATTTTEEIINTNRINLLEAKRFSKWTKMIRTTVRVLKFLKKLSKGKLTWLSSVSERNPIYTRGLQSRCGTTNKTIPIGRYNSRRSGKVQSALCRQVLEIPEQTTIAERQGILIPNNISPQTQSNNRTNYSTPPRNDASWRYPSNYFQNKKALLDSERKG
ncbi:Pao retrotransposon peptidase family protein [Brugia pahangi]